MLACGYCCPVDDPAIQSEPCTVFDCLDLVADGHMGVQVRVAVAGVSVLEDGGDEPLDVDLADTTLATTRVGDVALQPRHSSRHSRTVSVLDLLRHRSGRDRPQR